MDHMDPLLMDARKVPLTDGPGGSGSGPGDDKGGWVRGGSKRRRVWTSRSWDVGGWVVGVGVWRRRSLRNTWG